MNEAQTGRPAHRSAGAPTEKSVWRQVLALALAVGITIGVLALTTQYQTQIQSLGNASLIGLFVVSILSNATLIIPAPGFVFACAAGTLFSSVTVGIVAGLGAALGELTGYMAGYGGTAVIPKGRVYEALYVFMQRHGTLTIFLLAAIPNPIFDVGGLLAGVVHLPVWKFLLAAWVGKAIRLGLVALACLFGIPWLQQLGAPQ